MIGALVFGVNPGDDPIIKDSKSQVSAVVGITVLLFGTSIWAASTWADPLFNLPF